MPSQSEYLDAFQSLFSQNKLSDLHIEILRIQYWSTDCSISSVDLSKILGESLSTINLNYGRLGHLLADEMGFVPERRDSGTYRWWKVLSEGWRNSESRFIWKMHPEVVQALERIDSFMQQAASYPDEIATTDIFVEGAVRQITVNNYERNSVARKKCIKHHGARCVVCGFNFEEVYGIYGRGYIHVHHLRPLAEIGQKYTIDPIDDLRPVCPNCHAMIHVKNPPFTIEEVQAIINKSS